MAMGDLADARNPFEGIVSFMPIVVEVDVGHLPNVKKKLDDVAVNAIVGKTGVVHIDSLPFAAPNGCYMGSRLPQVEDDYIVLPSEIEADKLLQRMWREGYVINQYFTMSTSCEQFIHQLLAGYPNKTLSGSTPKY